MQDNMHDKVNDKSKLEPILNVAHVEQFSLTFPEFQIKTTMKFQYNQFINLLTAHLLTSVLKSLKKIYAHEEKFCHPLTDVNIIH